MIIWLVFLALIAILLALDLGVFHKSSHEVSTREALRWTALWVTISLLFSGVIYWLYSEEMIDNIDRLSPENAVLKYITGYIIEYSLSLDNIFVIAVIFSYFKIPRQYQHRVLFWGILGAVLFRGLMIVMGVVLIHQFKWMTLVFGLILLYSAYRMLVSKEEAKDLRDNTIVKLVKKRFPLTDTIEGQQFFVKKRHITAATPLFIALIVIETTDILFAVDSIPAILAITTDPFLVFSSNIFAILGLRSLYFVLSSMLDRFHLLKYSLVFILAFVGVKMLLAYFHIELPEWLSLSIIVVALGSGVAASLWQSRPRKA